MIEANPQTQKTDARLQRETPLAEEFARARDLRFQRGAVAAFAQLIVFASAAVGDGATALLYAIRRR